MSDFEMWFGSEISYKQAQTALKEANNNQPQLDSGNEFDPTYYGLLSVHDGVGIINITGSMVTNAPAYATYWGVIGYNVIKDTLTIAAQDPEIDQILLNIDSGGGSANGVDSVASLIHKISNEHKPVTSFTEGSMCSAAFWIGSAADSVFATRLATVGSIGVIAVSMEYTKMLEEAGITPKVFRAGEFKALGSPYEVLDEKATTEIQGKLDTLYGEFVTNISVERGLPQATAKSTWAEGRTFLGFEGQQVGLVDQITTFEDLANVLQKASTPTGMGRMQLSTEANVAKRTKVLSAQDVAVLAAGGTIDAQATDPAEPQTTEEPEVTPEASSETVVTPEPTAAEAEAGYKEGQFIEDRLISHLKAELSAEKEKTLNLTIENRDLTSKVTSMEANQTGLRNIAMEAINFKYIALGRTNTDLSATTDEGLVQLYAKATGEFQKTFPVGGVTEAASTEREKIKQTPAEKRALRAAEIGAKHGK